ncbi:F-box only protein 6 [Selaginella moellendorffii]|uniref:F-box only protein 6 n=1 Tax=Selaginella moellendorffii TaxID=88036 RepID=UPI000D1CE5FF|nr:F-box only protein 6 [Selaginella moellendorffii]|eukprot:XP_024532282.1 F-box only protein 6 [Selaginella moellendorffii]
MRLFHVLKRKRLLPEEISELVLLRLPFSSVITSRLVCKEWKSIVDSPSFTRCYSDNVTIIEEMEKSDIPTYRIIDSSNKIMLWTGQGFLSIGSYNQGLMVAYSPKEGQYYVGNPFFNKWKKIPMLEHSSHHRVRIFVNQESYKLVAWEDLGSVLTFSRGQTCWSKTEGSGFTTDPVMIDDKIFVVDTVKERLIMYTEGGSFSYRALRIGCKYSAYMNLDCKTYLRAWERKLYAVVIKENAPYSTRVRIWEIPDKVKLVSEIVFDDVAVGLALEVGSGQYLNFSTSDGFTCSYDMKVNNSWESRRFRDVSPMYLDTDRKPLFKTARAADKQPT